jgi:preprotein translocase subunit SecB
MSKTPTSDTTPESPGNGSGKPASPESAAAPKGQPSMRILGQYLKDLSFENPHAPQSLSQQQQPQPDVAISVNVNARNVGGNDFDVELQIGAKAMAQEKVTFMAELVYGGTFRLENFPPQMLHPAVLIECPRMLFPFARQILAEATRNGGFPPLMLDPIDFASMYQRRMQQQTVGQA